MYVRHLPWYLAHRKCPEQGDRAHPVTYVDNAFWTCAVHDPSDPMVPSLYTVAIIIFLTCNFVFVSLRV